MASESSITGITHEGNVKTEDPWLISVKTVGGGFDSNESSIADPSSGGVCASGENQFTVKVSPEDSLNSLYDQIEASTGLKACQQRLIYRGRLIGQNNPGGDGSSPAGSPAKASLKDDGSTPSNKIKDIAGLSDGQTIHLVKKRATPESSGDAADASSSSGRSSATATENDILGSSSGGSGSGGLLAALLGLSNMPEGGESGEATPATAGSSTGGGRQRFGMRGPRLQGSARSRRPHYRMTAEDLEVPDPGSMEPVRQGLMTLHTLLPHMNNQESISSSHATPSVYASPIESNREWYRGQWLDCRDTVNQWLEATIVEIVHPHEILPEEVSLSTRPRRRPPILADDAAVSASDLEGRRRLLLEPCEGNPEGDLGGELAGFRRRSNNDGVQLLLIHYNGWPHRWDEWIRSDSERIRPFRTRTRHPSVSSTASPTPQSVFHESPRTNILNNGDEQDDRMVVLPEIARTMAAVNDMLQQIVQQSQRDQVVVDTPVAETDLSESGDLPWSQNEVAPEAEHVGAEDSESTADVFVPFGALAPADDELEEAEEAFEEPQDATLATPSQPPRYNQTELRNLATLLDRLGRTLTDVAPHVASMAANLPEETLPTLDETTEAEEESSPASTENASQESVDSDGENGGSLSGLLSLWSRERRRANREDHEIVDGEGAALNEQGVDPDHVDYVSGLVNTTRGEVRSGPRSRSSNDDVAGLLGAYLAAASLGGLSSSGEGEGEGPPIGGLGQLLRGGGSGAGGGIDIHIHAVVTAPGMAPGGLGVATLGGGGGGSVTPTGGGSGGGGSSTGSGLGGTRSLFSSIPRRSSGTSSLLRSSRRSTSALNNSSSNMNDANIANPDLSNDEEDIGLFSELYSETPAPVDPNGSPIPGEGSRPCSNSMDMLSNAAEESIGDLAIHGSSFGNIRRHEEESTTDFLERINRASALDSADANASGVSSTRRRSSRRTSPARTPEESTSNNASTRRSSGWGRLFRRRRSSQDP